MLAIRLTLLLTPLCLVACNGPTLSPERQVPVFSSENYEHLDCSQLRNEIDKLSSVIGQLSGVKNEPHYVMHTDMPLVGTGDNMGAIELIKSKAERSAIQKTYDKKNCPRSTD